MESESLKSCPFCGNAAREYDYDTETDTWPVECDNPDCDARVHGRHSPADAVARWNRRATPATDGPVTVPDEVREAVRLVCQALESRMGSQPEIDTVRAWLSGLAKGEVSDG